MKLAKFALISIILLSATVLHAQEKYEDLIAKIDSYYISGDFEAGTKYLESRVAAYETGKIKMDSNFSFFTSELSNMYYQINDFDKTLILAQKTCKIDKSVFGEKSLHYITSLVNLGETNRTIGNLGAASAIFAQADSLCKSIKFSDSLVYFQLIKSEGLLYSDLGQISKAIEFMTKALIFNERMNNASLETTLGNLAVLTKEIGDYAKAENYYNRTLEIEKNLYGDQHPSYAFTLNNLAVFYSELGDYEQAERVLNKAIEIFNANKGMFEIDKATSLLSLSTIYSSKNELDKARQYADEAYSIINQALAHESKLHFTTLAQLANIEDLSGNTPKAKSLYLQAINILTKINPEHYTLPVYYINLADIYSTEKSLDSAAFWLKKGLSISKSSLRRIHPYQIGCQSGLATVLGTQGKLDEAKALFETSQKQIKETLVANFGFLTENQQSDFFKELYLDYTRYLTFVSANYKKHPDLIDQAFDMQLFIKGLMLNSSKSLKNKVSKNAELLAMYEQWVAYKEMIAKSIVSGKKSTIPNVDSLVSLSNELEKKLIKSSGAFEQYISKMGNLGFKQVQSKLNPNEAFVALIRFPVSETKSSDSIIYFALVLTSETKQHPLLVVLPDGNNLDGGYYSEYIEKIRQGRNIDAQYEDQESYNRYWKPIEKLVSGKKNIYLLPDGTYHLINIGALQDSKNSYLIDKHDFIILSSINDFKSGSINNPKGIHKAMLFGDPTFNLGNPSQPSVPGSGSRNSSIELGSLPGTRIEVELIESLFKEHQWNAKAFTGINASESNLKIKSSPNVLLISTHGFYGGGQQLAESQTTGTRQANANPKFAYSLIKPMLNSGLYLAGAQNSLNTSEKPLFGKDDGIVTSYEISSLSFDSLNLVVLSSCQSGLGKVNPEGVYGLQRAFREAGADNVLISLWDIDDNASQLFIRKFMEHYLKGENVRLALKEAQLYFRNQTVYKHPYYWASFICIGVDQQEEGNALGTKLVLSLIIIASLITIVLILLAINKRKKAKTESSQK
jgi:CHAT domain-containing protein